MQVKNKLNLYNVKNLIFDTKIKIKINSPDHISKDCLKFSFKPLQMS